MSVGVLPAPAGPRIVASVPTGTTVGISGGPATSPRSIDIRSPRFVRDGGTLPTVNFYEWDGAALAVDVPLPDIFIGYDKNSLYAIDYGDESRESAHHIELVQITIPH